MTAAVGFPTLRLVRAAIGKLELLTLALPPGQWCDLPPRAPWDGLPPRWHAKRPAE
jgi:23S rRNA pseudouridine2457 synthase